MIDYNDYLTPLEVEWNTNTWLDQGVPQHKIDKWLRTQAHIVKADQLKASGTNDIKGGASFIGAMFMFMVLVFILFMIIAVIGS